MATGYNTCKDRIWVPGPKDGWTQTQQAQNNEFVESEMENWAKISCTTKGPMTRIGRYIDLK